MSFPETLPSKKPMKMKFLHEKIYYNPSLNDSNIIDSATPDHGIGTLNSLCIML